VIELTGAVTWERVALGAALAAAIASVALRLRALDRSGAVASVIVGAATLGFGGLPVALPVVTFFLAGTLLSRLSFPGAADARSVALKGATRDASQVVANGGAAAFCAIVAGLSSPDRSLHWIAAAVGALSVASSDTWATEVGMRSKTPPRSIVTLRRVKAGVSGGVTLLGFLASAAGGALIGAAAAPFEPRLHASIWIGLGSGVGFAGSVLDSLLGATVQGAWRCNQCHALCEGPAHRCGGQATRIGGFGVVGNDTVNALSTVAGALLGWFASSLVH
jgi:uncharacterized protein (TIGR00297 family)